MGKGAHLCLTHSHDHSNPRVITLEKIKWQKRRRASAKSTRRTTSNCSKLILKPAPR